ncbi:MAG: helix-turn-helix domain-containing protein [Gluconobacter sp.]
MAVCPHDDSRRGNTVKIGGNQPKARVFRKLNAETQREAYQSVLQHVRTCLNRGPYNVLELRANLTPEQAGALPDALVTLAKAGEIAALGHSVYARVPWMPATRTVVTSPIHDLVFASLTEHETAGEIAPWLGLKVAVVREALEALEQAGLIEERLDPRRPNRYRIVSPHMAKHIRQGAQDRTFTDIARHG